MATKHTLIDKLLTAATHMQEAAKEMRRHYDKESGALDNATELEGAAGMILTWIEDIKEEL